MTPDQNKGIADWDATHYQQGKPNYAVRLLGCRNNETQIICRSGGGTTPV